MKRAAMYQICGWGLRANFAAVARKMGMLLLFGMLSGPALAIFHSPVVKLSTSTLAYTSPATIVLSGSIDPIDNEFRDVQLMDETGAVLATQYTTGPVFTLTGVTSGHTYHINARVTGTDGKAYNRASNYLTVTVTAPTIKPQTINFPQPATTSYGVGSVALSATATSGLGVAYASNSPGVCSVSGASASILAAGTCSITASQTGNGQYSAATAVTQSFSILKANQSITFNAPTAQVYSVGSVSLSGNASSGLALTYSSSSSTVCTVSGSTVSITGVGTCSITANQGGNANYNAATAVARSFVVSKANQSISIANIGAKALGTPPFNISATATSGLAVNYGSSTPAICTVSGSTVTPVGYGSCTITANQPGNTYYNPAPQASQSFSVSYAAQTITFGSLATRTFGAAPFGVSASASSGLVVTFSSQTPTVCAVSGTAVSLLSGGSCRIAADQAGNGYYAAAPQATQTFTVLKASQSISFGALLVQSLGSPSFTVSATATSGLTVTFVSATPSVCTVSGSTVSLLTTGTCTIAANQAGNASYGSATQVLQSATVLPAGTPGNGATFVSQSIPATLRAGQPYTIQVTMNNSGSTAWSEASNIRLGAQNPQDTRQWTIAGRALLPSGTSVAAGQSFTFSIPVTAPTTPGTYNLQWRMVQDGVEWFGPYSTNAVVTVVANTGPSATLSVTPTNVRMNGATPATLTFVGSGAEAGRTISKLELFQGTALATGYSLTPINTVTGSAGGLTMNYSASATAGDYWYKLRATDDQGAVTESAAVVVNVTNSSLLGAISGVRIDGSNKPQLVGWVCQPGVSQPLSYQVYLDAPTAQTGGQPLVSGVANLTTEPDNASVQSQCATPGVGHHFNVDLSTYTAQYAGRALYVQGTAYSGGGTVVLPCADNSCTMPGAMRVGLTTPANGDQYAGPATVFMRALISGATGPFDEVAFSVDGGTWIAGAADTMAGTYYANSSPLSTRAAPYSVQARVRKGNTTLYTVQNMITVGTSSSVAVQQTSPASGANFNAGAPITLSATATGSAVQSVQFYANGALVGSGNNSGGTWSYAWSTNISGPYALTAQAFDGGGHVLSASPAVNITVGATGTASSSAPLPVILSVPHLGNPDAGTLPGSLGVDANGAATYSIAIAVPPGTAGMQPNLALNYSSSGTNGVAGQGWSLSGLSSIHRCGKTIAQDNVNAPIGFTTADRLCLDGQRLVRVNGAAVALDADLATKDAAYWAAGGEYRTEIDSLSRITAINGPTISGIGTGIAFKVESKDGKIRYYGCDINGGACSGSNASNSYVAVSSTALYPQDAGVPNKVGQAIFWALSTIADRSGNHIDFDYSINATTGEHLPVQIRYGGNYNLPQNHYAAVRFGYQVRDDAWTRYIADARNDQRNRLLTVSTYVNTVGAVGDTSGKQVRNYTLAYERSPSSGRSLLDSVTVCATDSGGTRTCQQPTTFAWGKPRSDVTPAFTSLAPGLGWGGTGIAACAQGGNAAPCLQTYGQILSGSIMYGGNTHADYFDFSDIENNGRTDLLEKRAADPSPGRLLNTYSVDATLALMSSNPQHPPGFMQTSYRYFQNTGNGFKQYSYALSTGEYFVVLGVADYNGDGFPDLLVLTGSDDGVNGSGQGAPKVCLSPLTPATTPVAGNLVFNCNSGLAASGENASPYLPTVIDVAGDGRAGIYSKMRVDSSWTLCLQGGCIANPPNLPPVLTNTDMTLYKEIYPYAQPYVAFSQSVDFSGTGKHELVEWSQPKSVPDCTGDGCSLYQGRPCAVPPFCQVWTGMTPKLTISAFVPPGGAIPPSLSHSHPTLPEQAYTPYSFDAAANMASLSADFNGSGYNALFYGLYINGKNADNYVVAAESQGWQCLSAGQHLDCTLRQALSSNAAKGTNGYMKTLAVADFDGDGQADLLMVPVDNKGVSNGNSLQLCHLMGDDTTGGTGTADANVKCTSWALPGITAEQLRTVVNFSGAYMTDQIYVLDLLGTGRPQLVYYHAGAYSCSNCTNATWIEDGRWEVFAPTDLAAPGQALDRIYSVTNGLGSTSSVTYVDGLATGAVATSGTASLSYPQRLSPRTGKIVGTLTVANGGSRTRTTQYRYLDSAIDVAGRGSLGFGTVKSFDPDTHMLTTTSYKQAWPYSGMVASATVIHGGSNITDTSGVTISSTVNTPTIINVAQANGTATVCPLIAHSTTGRWDLDGSGLGASDTVNQYSDGWCNLTQQTVTLTPPGGGGPFVTQTNTSYLNDAKAWVAGLPALVTVKKTDPVSGSLTRTAAYAYDQVPGLLHTETTEPGDAQYQVVTTYDRSTNKYGLVGKKTQAWQDPACVNNTVTPACAASKTRTVSDVTYDALGRFPYQVKNALGHLETHGYDGATGARTSLTGPNNLTTQWTVDGFGRVSREQRADGNETRQYLKACQGDCPLGASVAQITDSYHGADRTSVPKVVYSDDAGHVLRTMTWGFDGRQIDADQRYDLLGRLWESDQPRFDGDTPHLASRQLYDDLHRVVELDTLDDGGALLRNTTWYQGLTRVLTNARNQSRTETRNVADQLVQVQAQDTVTNITRFGYEPFGGLSKTTDPNGNVITVLYDRLGRKTELHDPDLGFIEYSVDPLGQTWKQVSPKQRGAAQASYMVYDLLGRMTARYEPDLESHWVFDQATKGVGQLNEAYTIAGGLKNYDRTHTFDALGRPSQTTQTLSDGGYTSLTGYDAWSRVITQTYQRKSDAAKVFDTRYNNYGYLARVERGPLMLWKANVLDASARPRTVVLGNGLTDSKHYNDYTGRLDLATLTTAASAQQLLESYQYDVLGNVSNRTQYWGAGAAQVGYSEDFTYDGLNRLWTSHIQGQPDQLIFTYDAAGNILSKTGTGGLYAYPPQAAATLNQPHAVQSIGGIAGKFVYDLNGNQTDAPGRTATWSSFDMPLRLTKGGETSDFAYGPEHQRTRQDRSDGTTVVYAGAQEVEESRGGVPTAVKTYWPMGIGVEIDDPVKGTTALHWLHADRLGSPVAFTDQGGALQEPLAYDAWGKRRMLTTSATPDELDGKIDNRGFTGHEMLDKLDLVHMNGRVYDPYTARFLSADPHVTDPTNGQNYNRYSYVVNNPTNLTDPTGFDINWRWLQLTMGWGSSAEYYDRKENSSNNGASQAAAATTQRINSSNTNSNSAKDGGASANGGGSGPLCTEGSSAETCATLTNNIVQDQVPVVVVKPDGYVRAKSSTFKVTPADRQVGTMIGIAASGLPFDRAAVGLYRGAQAIQAARAARALRTSEGMANSVNGMRLNAQLAAEQAAGARAPSAITEYSEHALEQIAGRDGGIGVSQAALEDAFANPTNIKFAPSKYGPTFQYIGQDATIVVNSEGKVVTGWGTSAAGVK